MPITHRPLFHFSPPHGWTNDPNGLVYHNGLWHLFYQHEPANMGRGPMHWGHAVSRDLIHWEHWPIAISPDELGAIWSGSAAVHVRADGTEELVACFTHSNEQHQVQSLAFSHDDGKTWRKYDGNPVLTSDRPDFRDPKIFRYRERWIMVVSGGHEAQFYASDNLTNWTLLSLLPSPEPGWIWECPDLMEVDGRWILSVSFIVPGSKATDGSRTFYFIGHFDGTRFTSRSGPHLLSFGPDDYAAVSWNNAPHGRTLIIGWMSHWHYAARTPTRDENWLGAMTMPRELSFKDGVLRQNPPVELLALRGDAIPFDSNEIFDAGETYEIEAEIDISNLQTPIGFALRAGADEATRVLWDGATNELLIDRMQSGQTGFSPEFAGIFSAPLEVSNGVLKLRIFVDRCSVEVFAQDGELYGAALIFPSGESNGVRFIGDSPRLKTGVLYPLQSGLKTAPK